MNKMKELRIEKITLNIGAGKDQTRLEKAQMLLKNITGIVPVRTFAKKRIPNWGLRPGLPIGCKITLRKDKASALLQKLLEAKEKSFKADQFDSSGNMAFGIQEYIEIPTVSYDPKIGIMGLQVCVTLERPGFRVKRRSYKRADISAKHLITKDAAIEFMRNKFGIKVGE
ncbi:50S ribosomal protein L5 [Candidatus Woesearchaeota archaeon]|nr:50S ribosomal protein L5 [Candidatus Woesearchaeota archaeon]